MLRQLSFGLKALALGRIHNFKTNNNYKSNIPFKIFTRNVITIIDPELSEEISEDEDENFWGEVCEDNDISRNSSYEIREHNQERIDDMKEFLNDIETGGLDDYPNGWRKEHLRRKTWRYNLKKNQKRAKSFRKVKGFMEFIDVQSLAYRKRSSLDIDQGFKSKY